MSIELLAVFTEFLWNWAFAAIVLCAGLAIGLVLGRRQVTHSHSHSAADRLEMQRLIEMLTPLVDWTRSLAEDMSQFRGLVGGVSQFFREAPERLNDRQRLDTAGLLSQVVDANEQLQQRLNQAEHMLNEQASEISTYMSEARTDALTGLPNRRAFDEDLARRMAEWRRYRRPLSIMMVDIDHFKKFNDTYGHQTGDEVLCQVTKLLRDTVRESDLVARYGGEEMAVVQPATDIQESCRGAQRARRAIETTRFAVDGQTLNVTVSLGTAECLESDNSTDLVKRADEALYAAKQAGRNRAYWHDGCCCLPVAGESAATSQPGIADSPATVPSNDDVCESHVSFAQICQDLRCRLEYVTTPAGKE
ncbi:MAG: GGDEF domain-containing protein [Pirellulaceae bacterium]